MADSELINVTVSILTLVLSALAGYALATFREAIKLRYKKDVSSWLDLAKFALTEGRDAVIELLPVVKSVFKKDIDDIKTILEFSNPIPKPASKDHAELELLKNQRQMQQDNLSVLQLELELANEFKDEAINLKIENDKIKEFNDKKGNRAELDTYLKS